LVVIKNEDLVWLKQYWLWILFEYYLKVEEGKLMFSFGKKYFALLFSTRHRSQLQNSTNRARKNSQEGG